MSSNLEIVLDGLARAVRGGTLAVLSDLLAPDVVWEGVRPEEQRCDGRQQAMHVIQHGRFARIPLTLSALEIIDCGPRVLVKVQGPGLHPPADDAADGQTGPDESEGQIYQLFTFADGKIVHWRAFLDREEALAAAGAGPREGR